MLTLITAVALAAGPTVGEAFPALDATTVPDGLAVTVPDEGGDYVVLELIRSIHW